MTIWNLLHLRRNSPGTVLALAAWAIALLAAAAPAPAVADEDEPEHATSVWAIARGGLLYDKWWAVLERDPPEETHPAYPAAGKKKGSATWRCKECHGWDYRGADGAYSKGSHYSGVKGIRAMVGADPDKIAVALRGGLHGYTKEMMSDSAIKKLALFVSLGQVDMDQYIDRASKKARGDAQNGAPLYQTICAVCHGFDGRTLNFKDEKKPEYIGTVAQVNPWETLHKIRHGQPGVGMIALGALDIQDQVDILAFAQTLPAK
jgi:thiosulfate dehydrogenase